MILLIMLFAGLTVAMLMLALVNAAPGRLLAARARLNSSLYSRWLRLEAWMTLACLPVDPATFAKTAATALAVVFLVTAPLLGFWIGASLAALGIGAMRWYLAARIANRAKYLAAELPAFLRLLASGLQSGFSLLQSFEMAAREGPPLIADEIRRVIQQVNFGAPLETALDEMAARLKHQDIDLVVTAIGISREVGGNLSETLSTLAGTIIQRGRLRRHVRVLTAQGRLSGWILSLLPVGLYVILSVINPEYTLKLVASPFGWAVIAVALVMEALGVLFVWRILRAGEDLLT